MEKAVNHTYRVTSSIAALRHSKLPQKQWCTSFEIKKGGYAYYLEEDTEQTINILIISNDFFEAMRRLQIVCSSKLRPCVKLWQYSLASAFHLDLSVLFCCLSAPPNMSILQLCQWRLTPTSRSLIAGFDGIVLDLQWAEESIEVEVTIQESYKTWFLACW